MNALHGFGCEVDFRTGVGIGGHIRLCRDIDFGIHDVAGDIGCLDKLARDASNGKLTPACGSVGVDGSVDDAVCDQALVVVHSDDTAHGVLSLYCSVYTTVGHIGVSLGLSGYSTECVGGGECSGCGTVVGRCSGAHVTYDTAGNACLRQVDDTVERA